MTFGASLQAVAQHLLFLLPTPSERVAMDARFIGVVSNDEGSTVTFSVLVVENDRSKVVGTLWAADEAGAKAMAPMLYPHQHSAMVDVRRAEERELPFRIGDTSPQQFC